MKFGVFRRVDVRRVDNVIEFYENSEIGIRLKHIKNFKAVVLCFDKISGNLAENLEIKPECSSDKNYKYSLACTLVYAKIEEEKIYFYVPMPIYKFKETYFP